MAWLPRDVGTSWLALLTCWAMVDMRHGWRAGLGLGRETRNEHGCCFLGLLPLLGWPLSCGPICPVPSQPLLPCSPPSWIWRMSSRPQLLRQPRTPGAAQHPWAPPRLPPPQTHGADHLFRQLLILGVVRPLHRPLGTPGGPLPLWGPLSTLGVGPRPLQLEKGPRPTHGGALMVSASPSIFVWTYLWACLV